MNIDKLKAGPDLDALIAEKVMGWKPAGWAHFESFGIPSYAGRHDDRLLQSPEEPKCKCCKLFQLWDRQDGNDYSGGRSIVKPGISFGTPAYSTDIAAAWQIVEKFKMSLAPTNKGWSASRHHLWEGPFGEGETAQLAICRAALNAQAFLDGIPRL